jgi:uncharacterized protein (TIGR03000 family)
MYSVVLAAMLTTGGQTPNWCHGCHGCSGFFAGCHGCHGCQGGWGCHGCGGCHGCWGACHGCRGCHGCAGCYGCWGGYPVVAAYGSSPYGYGGSSGYAGYYGYYGSCFGCYGCYGVYGGIAAASPVVAAVPVASVPRSVGDALAQVRLPVSQESSARIDLPTSETSSAQASAAVPAHVTIRLPADARLWVDGADCPLTSDTRSFDTPGLQPGKRYVYNIRAAVVRDGRTVEQTQRVVIAAGRQIDVTFGELNATSVTRR